MKAKLNERVLKVIDLLTGCGDGIDVRTTGAADQGYKDAKDKLSYITECCIYNDDFPVLTEEEKQQVILNIK